MEPKTKKTLAIGSTMIVLGLALYGLKYIEAPTRPLVLILTGALFIGAYFATKSQFSLVLGGILAGLGLGLFGEPRWMVLHEFTEIGLGVGFLLIYAIPLIHERRSHWWPLVPALVLFLLGFQRWGDFRRFIFSSRGWPILLVIVGALVLLGALGRSSSKKKDPQ
ncbi:MAG: hypothetical protein GY716_17810 [bacterium]|nr:hypothetical protein [bacterium]